MDESVSTRPTRTLRKRMMTLAIVIVGVYLAYLAALYVLQGRFLFPSYLAGPGGDPPTLTPQVEVWQHEPEDGVRVEAWLVRPGAPNPGAPVPAVIFAHGNGEVIANNMWLAQSYAALGYTVLMPEYRGYGRSTGTPTERGLVSDFVSLRDRLAELEEIDAQRIVYHGRSLGGGVLAQVAAQRPPAALVLESSFTSVSSMSWRYGAPPVLVRDRFETERVLPGLTCPVLFLHGTEDRIIPIAHAERNRAHVPGAKLVTRRAGHNDLWVGGEELWDEIEVFLEEALGR